MRFATIDIGTNTAQLLVVDVDNTRMNRVHAAERFVRLGEGVDAHGIIDEAAQDRLLAVLREYASTAHQYEADPIVAAGTSALRDARNSAEVCTRAWNEAGIRIDILSGEEEATWSFAAACAAVQDLQGECLVIDVGGGSTELITGTAKGSHSHYAEAVTARASLEVGCVRLTERYFDHHPPSPEGIDEVRRRISEALNRSGLDVSSSATTVGTAGTATALALVDLGPDATWDALHGGGFTLTYTDVQTWRQRLPTLTVDDILALHPSAMEGRADVFTVGVLLLERVMHHYAQDELYVSPYELRHGLALRHLSRER